MKQICKVSERSEFASTQRFRFSIRRSPRVSPVASPCDKWRMMGVKVHWVIEWRMNSLFSNRIWSNFEKNIKLWTDHQISDVHCYTFLSIFRRLSLIIFFSPKCIVWDTGVNIRSPHIPASPGPNSLHQLLGNPTNLAITGCFFFSTTGLGTWASKKTRVLLIKTTQKTRVLWIKIIQISTVHLKSFRWRCLLLLWNILWETRGLAGMSTWR